MKRLFIYVLSIAVINACTISNHVQKKISKQLNTDYLVKNVLDSFNKYEAQIIYTQINRDIYNKPSFKSYSWNAHPDYYFYPASMVKMPVAFLAVEKINQLSKEKKAIHLFTPMRTGSERSPQTSANTDSTSATLLPSVGHYLKKIFIVSDNDAFNRLYEFVGQEKINERLHTLDYLHSCIIHRLDAPEFDYEANKYTNPISLYEEDLKLYDQPETFNAKDVRVKGISSLLKGDGFIKDDQFISKPFDFSTKNYFSLEDMSQMIRAAMFPQSIESNKRFNITDEQWNFIRIQMSKLPRESRHPVYDSTHYDSYCKYFMFGDSHQHIPDHIRIFNKVGWAYGYLTDAAYIIDLKNNLEFILTATINSNTNRIYNDGKYEYSSIGLPFLSKIGRIIYQYESTRKKKYTPDLTAFKLNYNE